MVSDFDTQLFVGVEKTVDKKQAALVEREKEVKKFWEDNKIFEKIWE